MFDVIFVFSIVFFSILFWLFFLNISFDHSGFVLLILIVVMSVCKDVVCIFCWTDILEWHRLRCYCL